MTSPTSTQILLTHATHHTLTRDMRTTRDGIPARPLLLGAIDESVLELPSDRIK